MKENYKNFNDRTLINKCIKEKSKFILHDEDLKNVDSSTINLFLKNESNNKLLILEQNNDILIIRIGQSLIINN